MGGPQNAAQPPPLPFFSPRLLLTPCGSSRRSLWQSCGLLVKRRTEMVQGHTDLCPYPVAATRGCSATVGRKGWGGGGGGGFPASLGIYPPPQGAQGRLCGVRAELLAMRLGSKARGRFTSMSGVPSPAGPLSRLCRLFMRLQ